MIRHSRVSQSTGNEESNPNFIKKKLNESVFLGDATLPKYMAVRQFVIVVWIKVTHTPVWVYTIPLSNVFP